jgi:hypothetical protein
MSAANQSQTSYSADVRMQLRVNGRIFSIGQLGPDFIMLDDPADHPPAEAEIAVSIDGRLRRWPVYLPDGIAAGQAETRISDGPSGANGSTVR